MPIQNAAEPDLAKTGESHPPRSPWVRLFIYFVLIAAGAFIGWRVYQNKEKTAANTAHQAAALASRPVPVQVVPAEQKPMPIYLTGLGTVTPNFSVTVKARVSGELLPVKFTEGQEVKEGETIMVIDPKPYQASLDQAKGTLAHDQALLKNAQAEVNRYKALFAAGVVSRESMEANEAQLGQYQGAIQSDNAAVENAQLQLSWCYIKAPISGVISKRHVQAGEKLAPDMAVYSIVNLSELTLEAQVPASEIPRVKVGQDVKFRVDGYAQREFHGQVARINPATETGSRSMLVYISVKNDDSALRPGMFPKGRIVTDRSAVAPIVPLAALRSDKNGQPIVYKVDQGKLISQPVKLGLRNEDEGYAEVLDGLQQGAHVIVSRLDSLKPGAAVKLPPSAQAKSEEPAKG